MCSSFSICEPLLIDVLVLTYCKFNTVLNELKHYRINLFMKWTGSVDCYSMCSRKSTSLSSNYLSIIICTAFCNLHEQYWCKLFKNVKSRLMSLYTFRYSILEIFTRFRFGFKSLMKSINSTLWQLLLRCETWPMNSAVELLEMGSNCYIEKGDRNKAGLAEFMLFHVRLICPSFSETDLQGKYKRYCWFVRPGV